MKQLYKFRPIYIVYGVLTAVIFYAQTWKTAASGIPARDFRMALTSHCDTSRLPLNNDSLKKAAAATTDTTRLPGSDSSRTVTTIDTFSIKYSKDSLDAPLKYEAADSAVILIKDKKVLQT